MAPLLLRALARGPLAEPLLDRPLQLVEAREAEVEVAQGGRQAAGAQLADPLAELLTELQDASGRLRVRHPRDLLQKLAGGSQVGLATALEGQELRLQPD